MVGDGDLYREVPSYDPGWRKFCDAPNSYQYYWCDIWIDKVDFSPYLRPPYGPAVWQLRMDGYRYAKRTRYPLAKGFYTPNAGGGPVLISYNFTDLTYLTHWGLDLPANKGTFVFATAPGTVVKAADIDKAGTADGAGKGCGRYVIVQHSPEPTPQYTWYCHLDSYVVTEGQVVATGDRVGLSGNRGRSDAPHVHYGLCTLKEDPYNDPTHTFLYQYCTNPLETNWY